MQEGPFSAVADDEGSAASGDFDQSASGQVRVRPDGQDGHRQGGEERAAPGKVRDGIVAMSIFTQPSV